MMSSFGLWLKGLLKRWFGYVLGLCVVFAILGAGVFVFARPSLLSLVNAEVKKYGIDVESSDISMLGNVNLQDITIALKDGGVLTAGRFSGRPPLSWLGGTASLYDVVLKKDDMVLAIPELHFQNLFLSAKDPALPSPQIQLLARVSAARVDAPEIDAILGGEGKQEKLTIREFVLEGLRQGKARLIAAGSLDAALAAMHPGQKAPVVRSGMISAENVDIASAYAFVKGIALPGGEDSRPLAGPLQLDGLQMDMAGETGESVHLSVGRLASSGLSLRSAKTPLLPAIQAVLAAGRQDIPSGEKKKELLQDARAVLENIAAFDAEVSDAAMDSANLKMALSSFELKSRPGTGAASSAFLVRLQDLTLDLSQADNEYARFVRDMGYEKMQLSVLADMLWSFKERTLTLRNVSFSGNDMGEFSFKGTLLDVDEGIFSGDTSSMLAAFEEAAIAEFDMMLADTGIISRFIDWETVQINVPRQELKDDLYEIAVKTPLLLLKGSADAQRIADACGAFIRDSGVLRIHMAARDRTGLRLSDLSAGQNDISALLNLVELSVTTEKQPPGPAVIN